MAAGFTEEVETAASCAGGALRATAGGSEAPGDAPTDLERAGESADGKVRMYAEAEVRPRFRGALHTYAFFASLGCVGILLARASSARAIVAAVIYAFALLALFGTSALLHRRRWTPRACSFMRRLDHAMIYVLIAGTYTPVALLGLSGAWSIVALTVAWTGALAGIVLQLFWPRAPGWVAQALYLVNGWLVVFFVPPLIAAIGIGWVVVLIGGGILYTLGSINLARRRPNPAPAHFGYHEVFHTYVVLGAAAHFIVINFAVLPRG